MNHIFDAVGAADFFDKAWLCICAATVVLCCVLGEWPLVSAWVCISIQSVLILTLQYSNKLLREAIHGTLEALPAKDFS